MLREATVSGVSMETMVLMGLMAIALLELLDIILMGNKVVMELKVPLDLSENLELLVLMVCQAAMVKLVLL